MDTFLLFNIIFLNIFNSLFKVKLYENKIIFQIITTDLIKRTKYLPLGNDCKNRAEEDDWTKSSGGILCRTDASKNNCFWSIIESSSVQITGAMFCSTKQKNEHLIYIFFIIKNKKKNKSYFTKNGQNANKLYFRILHLFWVEN